MGLGVGSLVFQTFAWGAGVPQITAGPEIEMLLGFMIQGKSGIGIHDLRCPEDGANKDSVSDPI